MGHIGRGDGARKLPAAEPPPAGGVRAMREDGRPPAGDAHDLDRRRHQVEWEVVTVAREDPGRRAEPGRGDGGIEGPATGPDGRAEPVEGDVAERGEAPRAPAL